MSKEQELKKSRRGFLKSSLLLGGAAVAAGAAAELTTEPETVAPETKNPRQPVDTDHMKNYYQTLKR